MFMRCCPRCRPRAKGGTMDTWTEIGAVAAVIAAVGAVVGVGVAWWYGKRSVGDAQKSITYDRLREARELVGKIKLMADNTHWNDASEAAGQLRSVVATIDTDRPHTRLRRARTPRARSPAAISPRQSSISTP